MTPNVQLRTIFYADYKQPDGTIITKNLLNVLGFKQAWQQAEMIAKAEGLTLEDVYISAPLFDKLNKN